MENPSSKPRTANSERELLQTVYLAWSGEMCSRGLRGGGVRVMRSSVWGWDARKGKKRGEMQEGMRDTVYKSWEQQR